MVRMTRCHFQLIAETIAELSPELRRELAEHFARNLRCANPRFSPDRFVRVATGEAKR